MRPHTHGFPSGDRDEGTCDRVDTLGNEKMQREYIIWAMHLHIRRGEGKNSRHEFSTHRGFVDSTCFSHIMK